MKFKRLSRSTRIAIFLADVILSVLVVVTVTSLVALWVKAAIWTWKLVFP